MYYPSSENKGADQLRGYRESDLRLWFSHMQIVGFLMTRLILIVNNKKGNTKYDIKLLTNQTGITEEQIYVVNFKESMLDSNHNYRPIFLGSFPRQRYKDLPEAACQF